jgi:beta-N-acetylhexosaminidase
MSDDLGMKALGGPFDQRTAAALAAGCDVVLHCDGNMDDMRAVAKALTPLGPNGLRAMEELNAIRRKPREILNAAAGEAAVTNALRRA